MNSSASRQIILKKIRQALEHPTPLPFAQAENNNPVFLPPAQELEVEFAQQFTKLQGKFIYCLNQEELALQLRDLMAVNNWTSLYCCEPELRGALSSAPSINMTEESLGDCQAALTTCECLIARTGSIVLSTASASGRTVSVYAPVHLCVAYTAQLVYDIRDALQLLTRKFGSRLPSFITLATGPSRTADIEKTLVVGVHGPREVYLFLVDETTDS